MMSDQVISQIATGVIALIGSAVAGLFAYLMAKLNKQTQEIKKDTVVTKSLVNHQAIAMAKLYAVSCRTNANLTKDPGYIRVADEAEKVLSDLIIAQASVDAGEDIRNNAKS